MRDGWSVVLGTHHRHVSLEGVESRPLDLDSADTLARQIADVGPDLIVHAAGLTSVDGCESDPVLARHVNADLARNVAAVAAVRGVRLIHVSTDHLFAGERGGYREHDAPQPLNEYARSKLLAEEWVGVVHPHALVLRTNFFGWGHATRQSFSDWIIHALRADREIMLFDDVYFTPLLADNVAMAAHRLVERSAAGVFNVAGDERVTKFEFAVRLARVFGLPEKNIRRGSMATANLQAARPRDMSLNNAKMRALLGSSFGDLDEQLLNLRHQEEAGRRIELFHAVAE
jgi:dTDP-4-dehydrorhamnose reductase